jgi:hypothetical protein
MRNLKGKFKHYLQCIIIFLCNNDDGVETVNISANEKPVAKETVNMSANERNSQHISQ